MSLEVKCFATILEGYGNPSSSPLVGDQAFDGHIEIHSDMYNLVPKDFASIIFNIGKDAGIYTMNLKIGEGTESREISAASLPVFTRQSFEELNSKPVPLLNQTENISKEKDSRFISSRFWAFKKYFFVTNRSYSSNELSEIKMKIHYVVKKFEDEVIAIGEELRGCGIKY